MDKDEEESFTIKTLACHNDVKILSAALGSKCLLIGDDKGKLSLYGLDVKNNTITNCILEQSHSFKKGKPEKIIIAPSKQIVFVLINGDVQIFSLPALEPQYELKHKETVIGIAINATKTDELILLTISKKKRIRQFKIEENSFKELEQKMVTIENIPEYYQWYSNTFCYSYKNKIFWLDLNTHTTEYRELENIKGMQYCKQLLVFTDKELYLSLQPVDDCLKIPLDQIPIDFCDVKGYLISMHDNICKVYIQGGSQGYTFSQTLRFSNEKCKFICGNNEQIICICNVQGNNNHNIYELNQKNLHEMISSFLEKEHYDDAIKKINTNMLSASDNKIQIIEKFYLDAAWSALSKGNFQQAGKFARVVNSNPLEFMYLYHSLVHIKSTHDSKSKEAYSVISKLTELDENKLKEAYMFLLEYLKGKRQYFLNKSELLKDNHNNSGGPKFLSSEYNKFKLDISKESTKITDLFPLMDLTIIKLMILTKIEKPSELSMIIEHSNFTCQGSYELLNDPFFKQQKHLWQSEDKSKYYESDQFHMTMAYYLEKKNDFEKALQIWRNIGLKYKNNKESIFLNEAIERTKKIFKRFYVDDRKKTQYQTLFTRFVEWIIEVNPEEAFPIVIEAATPRVAKGPRFMSIEQFLKDVISEFEKKSPELKLKERFLVAYDNTCPNEQYQTMLIELYVNNLFDMIPQNSQKTEFTSDEEDTKKYYGTFLAALKKDNACYRKKQILEMIKGSWLKQAEIYLYTELSLYNDALDIYLEQVKNKKEESIMKGNNKQTTDINEIKQANIALFKQVERYCGENFKRKNDIYLDLFKKVLDRYKQSTDYYKQLYQDELLNILKCYGSLDKLDILYALENIPDDFDICEGELHEYLSTAVQEFIQMTNTHKFSKSISEMALLYKEKELYDTKDQGILIEKNTVCHLCRKPLESSIFVVYPNKRIFHQKCAPNSNICPLTGVDFSKKSII
jgi:hypothetical protein